MNLKDFLLAIFVTFIWGINFSVIKIGLNSLDPFILAGLRFLLCAFPLVFFLKKPNVSMKYIVCYGLIFGVGLWGMVTLGIYLNISAGIASLVLQLSAFFTVIMGAIILKETIGYSKKIAFIVALIGLGLIISVNDGTVSVLGLACVLAGAFSWSIANIIIKISKVKEVFSFIIYSSLFSPIPLFLLAYLTQDTQVFIGFFDNLDKKAIFSILFQVYPTTLFGYWVWNLLLSRNPVSSVAPISLLVPIFGLIGSSVIFNENISFIKMMACLLIVVALFINSFGNKLLIKKV